MSDCILSDQERKDFHELQLRAANLRQKKIDGEKDFLDSIGKEHSQAECVEIEKKRRKILHDLESEGAKIETEYIEKYRSKIIGTPFGGLGGLQIFGSCIICEKCVTSTCLNCTACSSCVLVSSL